MRSFAVLLLKEEMALFSSPIAYAVMTVFLLIMGYSFTLTLFHQPSAQHGACLLPDVRAVHADRAADHHAALGRGAKAADDGGAAHLAGLRGRDRAGEVSSPA